MRILRSLDHYIFFLMLLCVNSIVVHAQRKTAEDLVNLRQR
jgi:hypothetical protein